MIAERKFKIGTDVNTPVGVMRVMDYYWNDTSNNGVPHGCWAYYLAFLTKKGEPFIRRGWRVFDENRINLIFEVGVEYIIDGKLYTFSGLFEPKDYLSSPPACFKKGICLVFDEVNPIPFIAEGSIDRSTSLWISRDSSKLQEIKKYEI